MGVRTLLKAQPSVTAEAELLPVVSSRVLAISMECRRNEAKLKNFPKRMLRSISLTWSDECAAGNEGGGREVVGGG